MGGDDACSERLCGHGDCDDDDGDNFSDDYYLLRSAEGTKAKSSRTAFSLLYQFTCGSWMVYNCQLITITKKTVLNVLRFHLTS